jgi:hypothetical protein
MNIKKIFEKNGSSFNYIISLLMKIIVIEFKDQFLDHNQLFEIA